MCGILGFNWDDKELLKRMSSRINHRGPDQTGTYTDNGISLGHRRLSIIDLSENGKQPMHNEDNTVWVTFNGEIYNFKEIKTKLENKGHRFYSKTDTEVIVHAYEEYGERCVELFNGEFAFAIWDTKKKQLFLARDRFGIKPLFYNIKNGKIIFASEIKAILEHEEIKKQVCYEALHEFLSFRCNSLAKTMFEGIYKLLPGHTLVFKDGKATIKRYWNLRIDKEISGSEEDFAKILLGKLRKSVQMRMMSDVPLGAYLSGGIDSGAIVGLMSELSDKPVKTFSVGFAEQAHDELEKAKVLADHFETDHTEVLVKENAVKLLPKIAWHLDEPMCDATSIPIYMLAEKTKKDATVVLTGDGGDEQFAGYEQYKFIKMHQKYMRPLPLALRKTMPHIAKITPKKMLDMAFKYSSALGKEGIKRFADFAATNDYAEQYLDLVSVYSEKEKRELYTNKVNEELKGKDIAKDINKDLKGINNRNYLKRIIEVDTRKILAEDYLMKIDKNTMAFGIEARVPLLDHTLYEFTASLPMEMKLNGFKDKYIFRKAMSGLLPKETSQRKKERFFVPIHKWFNGELKDVAKDVLSKENIQKQGIFNHDYIDKAFKKWDDSRLYYSRQLWGLLWFQIWHRTYIEGSKPGKIL